MRTIPLLRKRHDKHRWESRFRLGVVCLLGGWILMLAGACGHSKQMQVESPDLPLWRDRIKQLDEINQRWQAYGAYQTKKAYPFSLAGRLAASVPDSMQLEGIRVTRLQQNEAHSYTVEMEGRSDSVASDADFRSWIEQLRSAPDPLQVKRIRLGQPEGAAFPFFIEAEVFPAREDHI